MMSISPKTLSISPQIYCGAPGYTPPTGAASSYRPFQVEFAARLHGGHVMGCACGGVPPYPPRDEHGGTRTGFPPNAGKLP
jgi:hypothetical protein